MKPSISMRLSATMPFIAAAALMLISCLGGCASNSERSDKSIAAMTMVPDHHGLHCGAMEMPPPEFDYAFTYTPPIKILPLWDIQAFCGTSGVPYFMNGRETGCATKSPQMIVIPKVGISGVTLDQQRCTFFHERSHALAGWPANHPGAVFW